MAAFADESASTSRIASCTTASPNVTASCRSGASTAWSELFASFAYTAANAFGASTFRRPANAAFKPFSTNTCRSVVSCLPRKSTSVASASGVPKEPMRRTAYVSRIGILPLAATSSARLGSWVHHGSSAYQYNSGRLWSLTSSPYCKSPLNKSHRSSCDINCNAEAKASRSRGDLSRPACHSLMMSSSLRALRRACAA
jgi:hypothetical protein